MIDRSQMLVGMAVHSSDGEKLGKVLTLEATTFIIEKGFLFPRDYVARYDHVASINGDDVQLTLTRDELISAGERSRQEEIRLPIVEEELETVRRETQAGEIRLEKDVVHETRHVDVPVTRDVVRVERVPASGASASPPEGAFERQSVSMPIREEEVEFRKRPVVKEEVRLRRDEQVEHRAADADVRREEVRVMGQGAEGEDLPKHLQTHVHTGEDPGAVGTTRAAPDDR